MKMQSQAITKNARVSPQKARLIVDQIKKMRPPEAVKILNFVNKKGAPILKKVIVSAIANARNYHDLDENSLTFKEIIVNKGLIFKRFHEGSKGRAMPIIKRTSHIKVIIEGEKAKKQQTEAKTKEASDGSKS